MYFFLLYCVFIYFKVICFYMGSGTPLQFILWFLTIDCNKVKYGQQQKQVTHSNTNPWSGHITRAVAAMDSCFSLVRPYQHGIDVGQKMGLNVLCSLPFTAEASAKHPFKRLLHTKQYCVYQTPRFMLKDQNTLDPYRGSVVSVSVWFLFY